MVTNNHFQNIVDHCETPTFVYYEDRLMANIERVTAAIEEVGLEGKIDLQASYFANSHPRIYKIIEKAGLGIVTQSVEEVYQLVKFMGIEKKLSAALSSAPNHELDFIMNPVRDVSVTVNVFLPEELEYCLNKSDNIFVRIDISPEQDQRTGLKISEFKSVNDLFDRIGKKPAGIHTYPGTGSDCQKLLNHANDVFENYNKYFPYVKNINLGGGFAFDYESSEGKHFPWKTYFEHLAKLIKEHQVPEDVVISIEPGRDLFADIGELLVSVNRVHCRENMPVTQVFTDGSYVFLPSASMKGRQHEVDFLDSEFNSVTERDAYCKLSGCTTLSSDYLFPGVVRAPSNISKGDYILIKDVGAYGASQHLEFLNKRPAAEVFVTKEGKLELITERGEYTDRLRNLRWQSLESD